MVNNDAKSRRGDQPCHSLQTYTTGRTSTALQDKLKDARGTTSYYKIENENKEMIVAVNTNMIYFIYH